MVLIKTRADFEAAHRQFGDENKCGYLHGHNWVVDFAIEGCVTDEVGYLINFTDLKGLIKQYDHKVLLWDKDPLAASLETLGQRVFRLPLNPTCENLATIIIQNIHDICLDNIVGIEVTVWENKDSLAACSWKRFNEGQ